MASRSLRRAVSACLFCAYPCLASPILDFEGTDFRANLAYNGTQASSSEPSAQPDGQSLTFTDDGPPTGNVMNFPSDQIWGVGTEQTPDPPGADVVTLQFEFWNLNSSSVLAAFPALVALEGLNSLGDTALAPAGPLHLEFEIGGIYQGPFDLDEGTGWSWAQVTEKNGGGVEYDLIVDLDGQTPADAFGLGSGDSIDKIKVSFDLTVPEPGTLALLATAWLCRPRRRRR